MTLLPCAVICYSLNDERVKALAARRSSPTSSAGTPRRSARKLSGKSKITRADELAITQRDLVPLDLI